MLEFVVVLFTAGFHTEFLGRGGGLRHIQHASFRVCVWGPESYRGSWMGVSLQWLHRFLKVESPMG